MKKVYAITIAPGTNKQSAMSHVENIFSTDDYLDDTFRCIPTDEELQFFKNQIWVTNIREECDTLLDCDEEPLDDAVQQIKDATRLHFPVATGITALNSWAIPRHSNDLNPFTGCGTQLDTEYSYDYDGTGVDIILRLARMPYEAVLNNTEEYGDRIKRFNWNSITPNLHNGGEPSLYNGSRVDYKNVKHAHQVLACVGSKSIGWAKNAHLYIMPRFNGNQLGANGSDEIGDTVKMFNTIRDFHNAKKVGGVATRPTVVIGSYGTAQKNLMNGLVGKVNFRGVDYTSVNGGLAFEQAERMYYSNPPGQFGIQGRPKVGNGGSGSLQSSAQQCEDAGVIMVWSAGNECAKYDLPGGLDYDNYCQLYDFSLANTTEKALLTTRHYYNRGDFKWSNNSIVVGNLDSDFGFTNTSGKEHISMTTSKGGRVDCFVAGTAISAPQTSGLYTYQVTGLVGGRYVTFNDRGNFSGTSFSAPFVAGMVACVLQKYPTTTPYQMRRYFRETLASSQTLYDPTTTPSKGTGDYGDHEYFYDNYSLLGAPNIITYLPKTIPQNPTTLFPATGLITAQNDVSNRNSPHPVNRKLNFTIDQINSKLTSV